MLCQVEISNTNISNAIQKCEKHSVGDLQDCYALKSLKNKHIYKYDIIR